MLGPAAKSRTAYPLRLARNVRRHYELYLFALPAVVYFVVFRYMPMYGVQIAFRDYYPGFSIWESAWVGWANFARFFRSYQIRTLITNTLRISLMSLGFGFPGPIILALMLNSVKRQGFKRVVQTASYAPYFISAVAMAGMIMIFTQTGGVINSLRAALGYDRIQFLGKPGLFPGLYTIANIWKGMGWGSIIYIAALSAVDASLYEAARIDGANRLRTMWHIELPSILPTIVVLLILNCGHLMSVGHEQILLLQNDLNLQTSEIISTYTYKIGLLKSDFSYSTAIGLFNSAINLALLTLVNAVSRRLSGSSLW